MATLSEKQAKLFTDRNWGVIATMREDGSPQATPVWIDYDGENVLVNSADAGLLRTGEQRVIIQIHPECVDGFGAGGEGWADAADRSRSRAGTRCGTDSDQEFAEPVAVSSTSE
jgi:hypothetical protein